MTHRIFKAIPVLVGIGLISSLAGCGTVSASKPPSGGTVVVALPVDSSPNWFFPVFSPQDFTATNEEVDALLYKPLLDVTNHNTIDYANSIVDKVSANKADTVFTLHINPKYHWSNGTPITAKDIVFTWHIMSTASSNAANLPWSYGGAGTGGVPNDFQSVAALNSSTVRITLRTAVNPSWFIRNGLGQINPVPAAVWNRYPHDPIKELSFINSVVNSPTSKWYSVVDGPYQLTSFTANQQWVFKPNPQYGGHLSQISKLIFQYETSAANEFTALRTGAVTVGYVPMSLWTARKQLSDYNVTSGYLWGMTYLQLNLNSNAPASINQTFHQLYVRQALAMGINQPSIIQNLFHGQGIEANGPIPSRPATPFYDHALNKLTYPFNPAAGKALLEHHGWQLQNGVMTRKGVKLAFSINYATGSQTSADIMQFLKSTWAQEGIQVTLIPTSGASFPIPNNKWDAIFFGMTSWVYSPDFYPTGGGLFKTGASLNFWGYSNQEMNHLVNLTYAPYSSTEQEMARLDTYQEFASKHVPLLFLPYGASFYVSSKSLHGYRSTLNLISGLLAPNYWSIQH